MILLIFVLLIRRGKHTLAFFPTYLMIQTSKNEVNVPYDAIKKVIVSSSIVSNAPNIHG